MFRELKEHFSDYTEQVVKLMVPMLKFYFHDGVRTAAAESLPFLLECAKIKGPAYLQEMWGFMLPELLKVGIFTVVIKSSVSGVYIISETHWKIYNPEQFLMHSEVYCKKMTLPSP